MFMRGLKQSTKQSLPWVYNRLRELKFVVQSEFFSATTIERVYGGHKLKVHLADRLARGWYDHDWDRLVEIDFLSANGLRRGALVFDMACTRMLSP